MHLVRSEVCCRTSKAYGISFMSVADQPLDESISLPVQPLWQSNCEASSDAVEWWRATVELRFNWVLQRHALLPDWSYVGLLHLSRDACSKWSCRDMLIQCLKPVAGREEVVHLDRTAHGSMNMKVRILWQSSHRVGQACLRQSLPHGSWLMGTGFCMETKAIPSSSS